MSLMQYGLMFAGVSSIALGIFHIPRVWTACFPQWLPGINSLSLLNRKMVNTLLSALGMTLAVLGSATLISLTQKPEANGFQMWFYLLCLALWVWRLVWQILYFPYRKINPIPQISALHVALIIVFLLNSVAYFAPLVAEYFV
jgi:hypothetical protein